MSLHITLPKARLAPVIGVILILFAGAKYMIDLKNGKLYAAAAQLVRDHAAGPVAAVGISAIPAGASDADAIAQNAFVMCPPPAASNLLERLRLAEPARFPSDAATTATWRVMLVYTNRVAVSMNALALKGYKGDVYVSIRQPLKPETNGPLTWATSYPAVLPDAEKLFKTIAEENAAAIEELPSLAAKLAAAAAAAAAEKEAAEETENSPAEDEEIGTGE